MPASRKRKQNAPDRSETFSTKSLCNYQGFCSQEKDLPVLQRPRALADSTPVKHRQKECVSEVDFNANRYFARSKACGPYSQRKISEFRFNRDLGVVPCCLGIDNKETNGEFWRSLTACSLESSSNLTTCWGDHRVRMIYHCHSLSLTAAADLAAAHFDRSRSAKVRTSPGSFLRTKAILRCKSILRESTFSWLIKFSICANARCRTG